MEVYPPEGSNSMPRNQFINYVPPNQAQVNMPNNVGNLIDVNVPRKRRIRKPRKEINVETIDTWDTVRRHNLPYP